MRMKDKVAIVTGGSGGIGTCTCERLVAEGVKLVIAEIEIDGANRLADRLRAAGHEVKTQQINVNELEAKLMVFTGEGVQEVWIDRNLLSRLNTFLYILLGADAFVLILVGFSAILVTMLATRFAILDRRRTIDLYWLMEVSPTTLRAPFIVEGLFQGFFGSLVALGIVFALHLIFAPLIGQMKFPYLELIGILIGLGLLFGWVGSGLAIDAFKLKRKQK